MNLYEHSGIALMLLNGISACGLLGAWYCKNMYQDCVRLNHNDLALVYRARILWCLIVSGIIALIVLFTSLKLLGMI